MLNPQLDRRGELIHLLTTEGLPRRHVERLLEVARGFAARVYAAGEAPAGPSSAMPVFLCLPDEAAQERDAFAAAAQRLSLSPVALGPQAGDALAETVARLA
ncbi:MAG TPA: aspartate carbamoyltransferase, partial [Achromobacter sp.]